MNNELIKAAQAVVDRWDSTDWKAAPTAEVMNRLRNALSAKPEPCCGEYSTCLRACTPLQQLRDLLLAIRGEETK